ncbi:MAG: putative toxin-antitoxin system toxin component, PIN family [Chloroflexi bacterium]|nr:putative toxin-antitoxin system toxin component, PIN family [Chloroflexota bacterium]
MRAVLDANVLVSALLSPHGSPAGLLSRWEAGQFELLYSADTLQELQRVLHYSRLRARYPLPEEEVRRFLWLFPRFATQVTPKETITFIASDPDDNRYLECAIAGGAEVIVSGDKHLLTLGDFRGIRILTSAEFTALLLLDSGRLDANTRQD